LRTDTATFLIDKKYAWSHFPQDDAPDWALFVDQVGYTGPGGFFVNHTVFAAIACMYNCDLTIIQSMPNDTHAFQLLSGKSLALELINPRYDETVQWRKANVQGVVQKLFLARRGMEHIMGTELLSSPLSTHAPRPQIHPMVGSSLRDVIAARPRMMTPSAAGAPSTGPLAPQASQVSAQVWGSRQFQITLGAGALQLRQRAKFLQLQGRSHLGLWRRKLYSPPTWERRLFQATLGARARQLLHLSQHELALRMAQGDFLAPIPALTLWMLDPSTKFLGQMYP